MPEERYAFVLGHQHGRRDVTCKPAILRLWAPDPEYQYFFFWWAVECLVLAAG